MREPSEPNLKFCFALSFSPLDQFVPLAKAGDESGWHAVALSDHVANPEVIESTYPYTEDGSRRWEPFTPWADPWVSIGAMAGSTTNLRFFTNVYVLPMRPPMAVAKAVGTAAAISGNRVALGVGMGWMAEEFKLLEQPFARRGKRADEMLEVLAKLWAGGWVEHHGEFYDFDRLEMSPTPTERIPIYVGGLSEPALRRAARHDGWISDLHTIDELREISEKLHRYREELGKADEPFAIIGSTLEAGDIDGYRRVADAGVTHLLTMPWVFYNGFTEDLGERIDGIHRFAEDIIAKY
jgi:probable F420-dependent oxidoreductase